MNPNSFPVWALIVEIVISLASPFTKNMALVPIIYINNAWLGIFLVTCIINIIFGVVLISRKKDKEIAILGIVLSVIALIVTAGINLFVMALSHAPLG